MVWHPNSSFYDVFAFNKGYVVQMIHMKYGTPDSELQNYAVQVTEILQGNASPDPYALVIHFVCFGLNMIFMIS
jgi:uncharacterized protein YfeS